MSEEKKDFVVKDRRFFSQEASEEKEHAQPETEPQEAMRPRPEEPRDKAREEAPHLPEINFATFVLSLHSSALVHLGVIENPATGEKVRSLPLAKQTIDILGIIEKKTQGNLDADEEALLKNILHDLRLMYVKEKD